VPCSAAMKHLDLGGRARESPMPAVTGDLRGAEFRLETLLADHGRVSTATSRSVVIPPFTAGWRSWSFLRQHGRSIIWDRVSPTGPGLVSEAAHPAMFHRRFRRSPGGQLPRPVSHGRDECSRRQGHGPMRESAPRVRRP
jgi:hypothetical protein